MVIWLLLINGGKMHYTIIFFRDKIEKKCRNIWDKEIFLLVFISFFIIHGEMIFNKISWWDDVSGVLGSVPDFNTPLPHGRWFCWVLDSLFRNGSLPVLNGIIVAVCIALISLILFDMFDIRNKIYKLSFGLILVSIPAVTANLGYMGASDSNFIGILICTFGAYLTCLAINSSKKLTFQYWLGVFLFACSLGEYQCYFSLYISLCLFYFLNSILTRPFSFKEFFNDWGYYILNISIGVALYLAILQVILRLTNVNLLSYANTDTYGIVSVFGYLERLKLSYFLFFNPYICPIANMFPFQWSGWYKVLLFLNLILCALVVAESFRTKTRVTRFQLYLLLFFIPCALNFNVILYGWEPLHSLHVYHHFLLFLLPLILLNSVADARNILHQSILKNLIKTLRIVVILILLVFGFLYVRYDNYCYMLSEFRLSQAISYFNTLTTKIMSLKDYREEYPVAFVNEQNKRSNADIIQDYYDFPVTNPYQYPFVNSYIESSRAFMKYWCGYAPRFVDGKKFENNSIVQSMPSYPNDGSIRIINNVIVVKF